MRRFLRSVGENMERPSLIPDQQMFLSPSSNIQSEFALPFDPDVMRFDAAGNVLLMEKGDKFVKAAVQLAQLEATKLCRAASGAETEVRSTYCRCSTLSSDGRRAAHWYDDGAVEISDIIRKVNYGFGKHRRDGAVLCIAIDRNGSRVASGDEDGKFS